MRKNVIYTELDFTCWSMVFRYKGMHGTYDLFQTKYRETVHEFFRYGKSEEQISNNKKWKKNRFLSNLIEGRIRKELKRVKKEDVYAGRSNEGFY